ncbi:MAG: penicillin-binding transpeptidase domain-containing protein, partial [Actinomycetota bacterium]
MTTDTPRLRLAILGVVVMSLFAALFARLWFLQILAAPTYQVAAESNRVRVVQEEAPRGRILDRQGRVIVDNRVSIVVTVERRELDAADDRDDVVYRLAGVLSRTPEEIEARLADKRYNQFQPVPVAEDVDEGAVIFIKEHQSQFPGVDVIREAVREYPYGPLAAHLLGYVGEINDEELEAREGNRAKPYQLGDSIGKSGVERIYEDDLRGAPGLVKLEVDSRGNSLRTLARRTPVPGNDVQLTIDLDIQALVEQSLAQQLARARQTRSADNRNVTYPASAGSAVVLDPRDGSIVAMASYPTYDPRQFIGGITTEAFAVLNDPANHYPLNNRAIQGQYAPGSTFKLITAAAGLRTGIINANTTVVDRGSLRIGNRTFRNAGGRAYGPVSTPRAITVSSDVFFYDLGRRFWEARSQYGDGIQATAADFGFGAETGVPLPSEQDGRIPTPDSRRRQHEANPEAFPEGSWFAGDNANLAIGQGE